jgi:hypothetical protein
MRRRKLVRRASANQLEFKPTQGPLANDNVLYHSLLVKRLASASVAVTTNRIWQFPIHAKFPSPI